MAPAQSKLAGSKRKKPAPTKTETDEEAVTTAPVETVTCDHSNTVQNPYKKSKPPANAGASSTASAHAGCPEADDKSGGDASSSSLPERKDKYADLKQHYKRNKSVTLAKKMRQQQKALPPAGNGKYNRIYTVGCMDDSDVVFVMHKRNSNEYAFTKVVDDVIRKDPAVKSAFGFDNLFLRVDPNNGNEYLAIEYTNRDKKTRNKYATIYQRKPNGDSRKEKREKWAKKVLVPMFNKFGQAKYCDGKWGDERFEYGGDLETDKWYDYLGNFITNQDVANIMKEDYAYSNTPLSPADMAKDRRLVEMYYGPEKVEEGIATLLSQGAKFRTGDTDSEQELKPYESENDEEAQK